MTIPENEPKKFDPRIFSVQMIFFLQAFLFGTWVTRLPAIKAHFRLSDGEIGALLMILPFGAVIASPIAGAMSLKVSMRPLNLLSLGWVAVAVGLVGLSNSLFQLSIAIALVGLGCGAVGVAMNAAAVETENALNRPILMRCHAMFSIGLAAGAMTAGFVGGAKVPYPLHFCLTGGLVIVISLLFAKNILNTKVAKSAEKTRFSWPKGSGLIVALAACGIQFTEGATMDWTAIFLGEILKTPPAYVGFGLMAFSGAMGLLRFFGDQALNRFQPHHLVSAAAFLAAIGYAIVVSANHYWQAIAGYVVLGFSLAPIMPTLFRVAGSMWPEQPALGVAVASTAATTGFLLGPAIIGLIAELGGLRLALAFVLGLLLVLSWLTRFLR